MKYRIFTNKQNTYLIMILSNKRTMFTVANEDSNLKLSGEVTITETNTITMFNGSFTALDGMAGKGGFNYSENGDTCNKAFYGLPIIGGDKAKNLLDNTITAIKAELTE